MPAVTDTSPEIAAMVHARLMALSGAQRFRMGAEMFEAARRMVLASLPAGLSEPERKRQLFARLYGGQFPADQDKPDGISSPASISKPSSF